MTKLEFKVNINNYKNLNSLIKEIFQKKYPEEEFVYFYIFDGKIKVYTESEMNFDLTKEVLAELMPDDLIF